MANSASYSYIQCDAFGLRQISSTFFGIPGFLGGLGSRGSSDSEPAWSPTSPLDFRGFVNLRNPFSSRSPNSSSQMCNQKEWNSSKVGLGIIKDLVEEYQSTNDVLDSSKRKNIVFGPQVRIGTLSSSGNSNESVDTLTNSNSSTRDYIFPPISLNKTLNFQLGSPSGDLEQEDVHLEPEPFESFVPGFSNSTRISSSPTASEENQTLSTKTFYIAGRATMSAPMVIGRGLQETDLAPKSSSLPPVGIGKGYVGSLSAREIALSEEYTCIISHGPIAKTTHIFGDSVLGCEVHERQNFDRLRVDTPRVAKSLECFTRYTFDDIFSFCYFCKKKLEKEKDIYMYRGEKAFCSFECRAKEILAEEEEEKQNNSSESSPASSYNEEDIFVKGLPVTP